MSTLIQESFLSGRVGFLNYRGLLRANLTQERFQVAFLWGTIIATVPIDQIKEVREVRNVIEFGVRVIWQDGYTRREFKFRSSRRYKWIAAFQRLGIATYPASGWFDFHQ
jgi:hypothetical protein